MAAIDDVAARIAVFVSPVEIPADPARVRLGSLPKIFRSQDRIWGLTRRTDHRRIHTNMSTPLPVVSTNTVGSVQDVTGSTLRPRLAERFRRPEWSDRFAEKNRPDPDADVGFDDPSSGSKTTQYFTDRRLSSVG